jgi:hypothetical protein
MDTLRNYMYSDIERAKKINANYLAALGLSVYTEHLGGLYRGSLGPGNSRKNYTEFIMNFFPGTYKEVEAQLQCLGGLYEVVRCGLVHEYFMKTYSTIRTSDSIGSKCGISYDPTNKPQLEFYVDVYYIDFKSAFEKYYGELIGGISSTIKNTREQDFDRAINNMPFRPFQRGSTSGSHLQTASGFSSSITLKGPPDYLEPNHE